MGSVVRLYAVADVIKKCDEILNEKGGLFTLCSHRPILENKGDASRYFVLELSRKDMSVKVIPMDTSKTRSIKSLLLQAWRERWTDISWGIHIKSMLPRGVSGDVYDLADCILQQALVGPGPSNLFLSYLMHSLSSRIVSYGAVLSSIGRYQSFYKPYCILSLLNLLKTIQSRIGCHGNEEECIALCKAVVSVTHWLYSCILYSISKLTEQKQSPEHVSMMEKSYEVLFYFSRSTFIKSLLYVGKFEDLSMYNQMLQKHKEFEYKANQISNATVPKEIMEGALSLVNSVDNLPMILCEKVPKSNQKLQILGSSINIMVTIDALLYPTSDISAFVNQLLLIKQLQNFTLPQLYCELIRTSMIGIANSSGPKEDLKWYSYMFLKIKQLISEIHSIQGTEDDLEKGLNMLLLYSPLLDLIDLKSNLNAVQYLTNEFFKLGLLTDTQMRNLITKRQNKTFKPVNPKSEQSLPTATLVLKAELTIKSIVKPFNCETSFVQETTLGMLVNVVRNKNLELILSALTAYGELPSFISKLILINDYCKFVNNETPKTALTRALLFDVTFLLLCYITQNYGIEIVTGNPDYRETFFSQWASECLTEAGKFKHPELLLSHCQQANVENLLAQFLDCDQEFKITQTKWHEVVVNAPAAAKEILIAWQHGALSNEKVKLILDYIKKQLCFLSVCISAWLHNYINILHDEERSKPLQMLQHFLIPYQNESSNSPGESPSGSEYLTVGGNYYIERSNLMITVIRKVMQDLHPTSNTESNLDCSTPYGLTVRTPLAKILDGIFCSAHAKGFLDMNSLKYFDTLLFVGGARWLCESLVERLLNYRYIKDINRAVDMILGIFYLDIEQCALALLLHVLPSYLYSEAHEELMAEPYSIAFSRLTAITTYAALQSRECSAAGNNIGYKRSHDELDIDDTKDLNELYRPSKIHRSNAELLEDTPFKLQSLSDESFRDAVANPINKAIADLMRTLLVIASDATISARSHFPIRFLEQVVLCAKDKVSAMLQFMPLGLVGLLFKKFPEEFSHELILAVSSMQSARARKVAALSLCQLTIAQNRLISKNHC